MTDEPTRNPCELADELLKTNVRRFTAVASKPHAEIAGALADELKAAIFKYEDRIPLALAVGVLRIVEQELIDGHR